VTIEIEYDISLGCIVINATGVIEYSDLPKLAQDLIAHKNFRTNINQIFDCSHGALNFTTNELKKIAYDFSQIDETLGLVRKLALVVSRDVDFGQMRQYEVFFESGPGVLVHVFRSLDDARVWISH
jgi:hypothetical protein